MKLATALTALLTVALIVGACGSDDDDDTVRTPVAKATATAPAKPEPTRPGTTAATAAATAKPGGSGVAIVDSVLAAVQAKDAAKLTGLLHFWPMACTGPGGIGALLCPAGSPVGTKVDVIGSGTCEGAFVQKNDPTITTGISNFLDKAGKRYAVLKAPTFPGSNPPPGDYQVVFEPGMVLSVDTQGITYLSFGCPAQGAKALIDSGRFGANPEYLVKP